MNHDPLIEQVFHGRAGGARGSDEPDLPYPPLSRTEFLAGAQAWVDAGAPCRAMGTVSHYEDNDAAYEHPIPLGKITVQQHAKRQVNITRYPDGTAKAKITASGSSVIVQTIHADGCTSVTTSTSSWQRVGPDEVPVEINFKVTPDDYTIRYVLPAETTRELQTGSNRNTCGVALGNGEPGLVELKWAPMTVTLHCPTEFPNRDGTMGCVATEPHDNGAANGALHQSVINNSDVREPRSWLYRSPMPVGRTDTGEGLPVHVKIIWALRLDQ